MRFTDKDLKLLKEYIENNHEPSEWFEAQEALLHRLAAAEVCAKHLQHMEPKCQFVKEWLASKGEI